MKKAKNNPFRGGKIMGRRQRLLAGIVAHASEWLVDRLLGEETDPHILAQQAGDSASEYHRYRGIGRSASAYAAIDEAERFVAHMANFHIYKDFFDRACRTLGISARTAENLMALLNFARVNPTAFDRLARLGRTKLYHVARLPEGRLAQLDGAKLAAMTDRELLAYLRKFAPVRQRKRVSGLRKRLVESVEIVENERLIAGYGEAELGFALKTTQELFGKLEKALDNVA